MHRSPVRARPKLSPNKTTSICIFAQLPGEKRRKSLQLWNASSEASRAPWFLVQIILSETHRRRAGARVQDARNLPISFDARERVERELDGIFDLTA
jgi:hypothetical protein